jgi:hypothetical protein|tara:strand:- start:473 stop:595 length:123 start_codon:yes stop_codon:yes gene_type:complete
MEAYLLNKTQKNKLSVIFGTFGDTGTFSDMGTDINLFVHK